MTLLDFKKPNKVNMVEGDEFYGKFEFSPLEPDFGITVGNAIRRVLISSLEGYAITHVKIEGVHHEFSTIKGVVEDVVNILLNLKQVRFKQKIEDVDSEKVNIIIEGKEVFKAGDLQEFIRGFEVLNPDVVICHMDPAVKLQMQININKGRGYVTAEENAKKIEEEDVDILPISSSFTPIRNVKYNVEPLRIKEELKYEKLIIEIQTDGSITPKDALKEAAKILIQHFMLFSDEKITVEMDSKDDIDSFDEEVLKVRQVLKTKLVDLNLSVRALNCLKAADVNTLGDLVQYKRDDLLKFRNFGKKSLAEIDNLLKNYKLSYGMDVSKYKLDKE
jgi:DNA-directed RNA polymerase subunit alpha